MKTQMFSSRQQKQATAFYTEPDKSGPPHNMLLRYHTQTLKLK
jgi:hypothetical protein